MSKELLDGLSGRFKTILADPPWRFSLASPCTSHPLSLIDRRVQASSRFGTEKACPKDNGKKNE